MSLAYRRYFLKTPLYLIGFMGAGKSSIGKELSNITGVEAIDTDNQIVKMLKKSISEIFRDTSQQDFRVVENKIIDTYSDKKKIISCGGGCIENKDNDKFLKNGYVVFLDVSFEVACKRVKNTGSRPLFNNISQAKDLYEKRLPIYKEYADLTVNTDWQDVSKIANNLVEDLVKEDILWL